MTSNSELPPNAIAVVGMAARLPGANTLSAFWDNLRRGEESIVDLSEDELISAGVGEKALANRSYVRRAALVPGIEEFDADFFGFTPQSARMMDPQHRLFLQTAFHALEDAGYEPDDIEASVGVFGTSSTSGVVEITIPPECCERWRGRPLISSIRNANAFQRGASRRPRSSSTCSGSIRPHESDSRAIRSISPCGSANALPRSRIAPRVL